MKQKTVLDIVQSKKSGVRLTMLTCYDYTFAKLIDKAGVDMVLVGDSLGNVILGYESTVQVQMQDMLRHLQAVARGLTVPLLCVDMPFLSYTCERDTLRNAKKLMQAGAHCVKLEGGKHICSQVKSLVQAGVPVVGHLGYTPQSFHAFGRHVVQGRGKDKQMQMLEDALALQDAGVFSLVLELVPAQLAQDISSQLHVPTIGIGAGKHCDGQVLVLYDVLGLYTDFSPKFLKKYATLAEEVEKAVERYVKEVKAGEFPQDKHSYN